jgi:hypothetical protein
MLHFYAPLLSMSGTTSTIVGTIGSRRMPSAADKKASIMPVIGRPPVLRVRHQGRQILFEGIDVEGLHFDRIIEVGRHGIGAVVVGLQRFQIQRLGKPVLVGGSIVAVQEGAFGVAHGIIFHIIGHFQSFVC